MGHCINPLTLSGKHNPEIIMSEQDQVVLPQEEQEQELEINLDLADDVETLKAELAKKTDAVRQLTARARNAEELVKKNREVTKQEPVVEKAAGVDLDEVIELRLDGYSKEEVSFIVKNGGRKALTDNSFVKVAIDKIREQKDAEKAIPEMDSNKSDIERKYTTEQLRTMPLKDLEKILPHA